MILSNLLIRPGVRVAYLESSLRPGSNGCVVPRLCPPTPLSENRLRRPVGRLPQHRTSSRTDSCYSMAKVGARGSECVPATAQLPSADCSRSPKKGYCCLFHVKQSPPLPRLGCVGGVDRCSCRTTSCR